MPLIGHQKVEHFNCFVYEAGLLLAEGSLVRCLKSVAAISPEATKNFGKTDYLLSQSTGPRFNPWSGN